MCRAVGRHKNVGVSYRLACLPPPDAPGQEDDDIYWDGDQQISNYLAQSQFWPKKIGTANFDIFVKGFDFQEVILSYTSLQPYDK